MREIQSGGVRAPAARPAGRKKLTPAATAAEPQETFQASGARKVRLSGKTAQAAAAGSAGMILGAGLGVVALLGSSGNPELKQLKKLVEDVRECLSDDLRKKEYQSNPNPMAGHCYVASEALYHKLGGKQAGWKPVSIQHEGGPHWFLRNADGLVVDPTADQFSTPVPYEEGRGTGFLTRQPSKRAQIVLTRLEELS